MATGLSASQSVIGGLVMLPSGAIVMGEGRLPLDPEWLKGVSAAYTLSPAPDHFVPIDKLVFSTSSMTSIADADAEVDDLLGGTGFHILYGGGEPDTVNIHGQLATNEEQEQEASELLKAARSTEADPLVRSAWRRFEESVFAGAVDALGGALALGMAVRDEADLLRAIGLGLPASVLASLRQAGFRNDDLEGVIAPRRTLARRKAGGQRLTRVESDAAWRLAHVFSLGARVLRGPEAAVAWLRRPKAALGDQAPIDLIETAVGAQAVERLLFRLEWGDVA